MYEQLWKRWILCMRQWISHSTLVRCPVKAVSRGPKHHFFGYYDKTPWDASGRFLLALEVDFLDGLPGPNDVAVVGVIDLERGNLFAPIGETRAWNWQQGTMACWMPSAPDRLIIYNDREEDHFVSVLVDIKSGARRTLPMPIYTISPDSRFALTINFARLWHTRPAYGYAGVPDPWRDALYPEDDGIYWLDLITGEFRLIVSFAQIAAFQYSPLMETGKHTIENLMINQDSTRFCFLHRFPLQDGGIYTRLLTADPDGSNLYLLAEGRISHLCWRDSKQVFAWARNLTVATKLRHKNVFASPLFGWALKWARRQHRGFVRQHIIGDCYRLFTDCTRDSEAIGVGILREDGHCTFSPNGQWLLTDTYPDQDHYRTLVLYNIEGKRRVDIGRFYSPPELSGVLNCDLHPRWNRDGTQVSIDSAHEGHRQMYVVDVHQVIQE